MTSTTKVTAAVVAGVLSLAVTGAAAFAAFQPSDATPAQTAIDTGSATAQTHPTTARDRIKDVLDKLVQNGTITQAQEDAIVQAFTDAAGKDKDGRKILASVLRSLMKTSADYLGLPPGQLRQQLMAGKTLGQIADATPGKSRDGLIAALTTDVNSQIDRLVANGTITADRAAALKAKVPDRIAKLVDRVFKRPGKAPTPSPAT